VPIWYKLQKIILVCVSESRESHLKRPLESLTGFVEEVVAVFRRHEAGIATKTNDKGPKSDDVLALLGPDLRRIGFQVEASKKKVNKLERPVFFGGNGNPTLRYEIDVYHEGWKYGLEVEAGRGWMGNAVYRDLVQAAVMVGVEHLCLAVCNVYRYRSGGTTSAGTDGETKGGNGRVPVGLGRGGAMTKVRGGGFGATLVLAVLLVVVSLAAGAGFTYLI